MDGGSSILSSPSTTSSTNPTSSTSAIVKNNKYYVQAGAGIVADSKPHKEYDETVNKAKALLNALK